MQPIWSSCRDDPSIHSPQDYSDGLVYHVANGSPCTLHGDPQFPNHSPYRRILRLVITVIDRKRAHALLLDVMISLTRSSEAAHSIHMRSTRLADNFEGSCDSSRCQCLRVGMMLDRILDPLCPEIPPLDFTAGISTPCIFSYHSFNIATTRRCQGF